MMNQRRPAGGMGAGQSGVMLLEVLIAILVFSLGILTIIGIQATSIKLTADAQLRTRAALLADRLVGEMWASGGNITELETKFKTGGTAYNDWLNDVKDSVKGLPGVVPDDPDSGTAPTVIIVPGGPIDGENRNAQVTITLFWRTPSMDADETPRQHVVTSHISRNP
ncbi:MAG: pilus assembly protein PilV [Candidatus Accumulibacter sp.]|jgi:type IV pilus assembly protein PilV|nr:pilus assembly protein PilV [Accumulibacter sp.]